MVGERGGRNLCRVPGCEACIGDRHLNLVELSGFEFQGFGHLVIRLVPIPGGLGRQPQRIGTLVGN